MNSPPLAAATSSSASLGSSEIDTCDSALNPSMIV